jgi:hypothetical protein
MISDEALFNIAQSFGFSEAESVALLEKVYARKSKDLVRTDAGTLSRLMIRECIFQVSSRLFEQTELRLLGRSAATPGISRMPLSVQVIYILTHILGFSEADAGEILKIPLWRIKENLSRVGVNHTLRT